MPPTRPPSTTPSAERPTGPLMPDDAPVIEPQAQRPHVSAQPTGARAWHQQPRTWFIVGAAVLLIAALGYAAFRALPKQTPPAFDLVLARAMVDGGNCDRAVVEHINPALSANPDDAAALELRRRCTAPAPLPPPESSAAPETTAEEPAAAPELDQVETLIAANGCSEAVQRVDAVLASDPSNARAQELAARAAACAAAMAPAPTAPHRRARCPDRRSGHQGATFPGRARPAASGTRQGLSEAEAGDAQTVR